MKTRLTLASAVVGASILAAGCVPQPMAVYGPVTAERCDRLAAYWNRYSNRSSQQVRPGQTDYEIGVQQCRRGDLRGGVAYLELALQRAGFIYVE